MSMEFAKNVAVLGIGTMGSAFARRLLSVGMHVSVWAPSRSAASELVNAGAHFPATPEEAVGDAGVVLTMVPTIAAIEEQCRARWPRCHARLSGYR